MITYEAKIRVNYKDTDQMGIVHHSNYIVFYEIARVEALRAWGMPYSEMEKQGVISPILEIGSKYIQPAYFDEVLTVRVIVEEMPMVRLKVRYELYNESGTLINIGHTWLGFLDGTTRRPCRAPEYFVNKMQELMDKSEKIYQIGDYYDDGKKQGVVFEVSEDGRHGKIVSLIESEESLKWCSDENEQMRLIGAIDEYDGASNMMKVKQIPNWREKYPAFAWCADMGEEWYLPALKELFDLRDDDFKSVNNTMDKFGTKLYDKFWSYWTSTECSYEFEDEQCAKSIDMIDGEVGNSRKYSSLYVRAVSVF